MPNQGATWQALAEQSSALAQWLADHAYLWETAPFYCRDAPWATSAPALLQASYALNADDVQRLRADNGACSAWARQYMPSLAQGEVLANLGSLNSSPLPHPDNFAKVAIKGAKWQQVQAFCGALLGQLASHRCKVDDLVEWCAGKAHLLRSLQTYLAPTRARALDWDGQLLEQARALAARDRLALATVKVDLLQNPANANLGRTSTVVALHACGDLHRHLIAQALAQQVHMLALAPCCYNRTVHSTYVAFSQTCQHHRLELRKEHLTFSLQSFGRANASTRRLREQEELWRLALDEMVRTTTGQDTYRATPSISTALLRGSFSEFCRVQAQRKGLPLPDHIDERHWLALGAQRRDRLHRHGLVRQLFLRPLESYLVLDQALCLAEAGYRLSVGSFCQPTLTPRNSMIVAQRSVGDS